MEFYWILHKLPEYLLRTDSQDTAFESKFMGERVAGLRELWDLMGGVKCAGVQTLLRRMAVQLGELERSGCIRLDQVWSSPPDKEVRDAFIAMCERLGDSTDRKPETILSQSQNTRQQLTDAIQSITQPSSGPQASKSQGRGRSPSTELIEEEQEKNGGVQTPRPTKRPKEGVKRGLGLETKPKPLPLPDYMEITPEQWETFKTREGTYRYIHPAWKEVEPSKDPWSIRGNVKGTLKPLAPCTCASRPRSRPAARSRGPTRGMRSTCRCRRTLRTRARGTSSSSTA